MEQYIKINRLEWFYFFILVHNLMFIAILVYTVSCSYVVS